MSIQLKALETEVSSLSAEVTRLRLMVQRCNDGESEQEQLKMENENLKRALEEARNLAAASKSSAAMNAVPPAMMVPSPAGFETLPSIFSGADGTARLLKAIMDAYPWLVPPEVKEAQEIVRQERDMQAEERRQRHQRRIQRQQAELKAEADASQLEREQMFKESQKIASGGCSAQAPSYNGQQPPIPHATGAATTGTPGSALLSLPPKPSESHQPSTNPVGSATVAATAASESIKTETPRGSGTPIHRPASVTGWERPPTPTSVIDGAESAVGGGSMTRSPTQLPSPLVTGQQTAGVNSLKPPAAAPASSTPIIGTTGVVLLGTRPAAKKAGQNILKKLRQGVASDSDDEEPTALVGSVLRSLTPPVTTTTIQGTNGDAHDF